MKNIKDVVSKAIKNIRYAMSGTITSIIKSNRTVYVKLYEEEEIRDAKIISPYGLFSLPLQNSQAQIVFNNTNKKAAIIGVEHDNLPINLDIGETLLYSNFNSYIHLKKDGKIYVKGAVYADNVIINNGSKNVAREGDTVSINVPTIGNCTGTITSGTSNLKA